MLCRGSDWGCEVRALAVGDGGNPDAWEGHQLPPATEGLCEPRPLASFSSDLGDPDRLGFPERFSRASIFGCLF